MAVCGLPRRVPDSFHMVLSSLSAQRSLSVILSSGLKGLGLHGLPALIRGSARETSTTLADPVARLRFGSSSKKGAGAPAGVTCLSSLFQGTRADIRPSLPHTFDQTVFSCAGRR